MPWLKFSSPSQWPLQHPPQSLLSWPEPSVHREREAFSPVRRHLFENWVWDREVLKQITGHYMNAS